jgi:predicted dehydrogenase
MQTNPSSNPKISISASSPLNRKVRLGMVGLRWGGYIAERINADNPFIEVVKVCDSNAQKGAEVSQRLGVPLSDWDSLLADPEIDAIGLFMGPAHRAKLIREVIRAGKDVLTTKPFENDVDAAHDVLQEAARLGRVVQLNSPTPTPMPDIRQIVAWQEEFSLGRPLAMRAETWAHYRETADGSWYDNPSACQAAPLIRLGIYFFNEFAALLGQPESVHVMHSRLFTGRPTADHAQVGIRYRNGALGHIFASFCVNDGQSYRDQVTLNYENATIRRWVERTPGTSGETHSAALELQTPSLRREVRTQPGQWCGWYQWETFHRAMRNKAGTSESEIESILFGLRLLSASNRSAQTGEPVNVGS